MYRVCAVRSRSWLCSFADSVFVSFACAFPLSLFLSLSSLPLALSLSPSSLPTLPFLSCRLAAQMSQPPSEPSAEATSPAAAPSTGTTAKPTFSFGGAGVKPATFTFGKAATGSPAAAPTAAPSGDKPKFTFAAGGGSFAFGGLKPAAAPTSASTATAGEDDEGGAEVELDESKTNPHSKALVHLEPVEVRTLEEDEETLLEVRAKLFRMDIATKEWKERGTGQCKLLKHKTNKKIRILMRRDKTLKICANHYITPQMQLRPNAGSDRAWMWKTLADMSDNHEGVIQAATAELLAIKFGTVETATQFKEVFEAAQRNNSTLLTHEAEVATAGGDSAASANTAAASPAAAPAESPAEAPAAAPASDAAATPPAST